MALSEDIKRMFTEFNQGKVTQANPTEVESIFAGLPPGNPNPPVTMGPNDIGAVVDPNINITYRRMRPEQFQQYPGSASSPSYLQNLRNMFGGGSNVPSTFAPSGGYGFIPQSQVPIPPNATGSLKDIARVAQPVADILFDGEVKMGGLQPAPTPSTQVAPTTPTTPTAPTAPEAVQGTKVTIPQGEAGSPQANFAARMASGKPLTPEEIAQANAFAESMGTTFNPETGYSRQPFLDATSAAQATPQAPITTVGGTPLSEFLQGGPQLDPQGRMIPSGFASRAEAFPEYEKEAAALQERINQRPDFGKAVSDRERRGTGEMSMAEATRMFGGDRVRARQAIEFQRQGRDPVTGQLMRDQGTMTTQEQVDLQRSLTGLQLDEMKVAEMQQKLQALPQERQQKFNKDISALQQVMQDTQRINEIGMRAGQDTGFGKTGVSGWLMSMVPGSASKDFRGDMNTLAADSAFSTLKAMKEASPTGGALGQITEKELDLLRDSQTALDPNLSQERIKANVKRYLKIRNDIMTKAYNGFVREYGKDVADTIMSGGATEQQGQPTGQAQPQTSVDYKGTNYEIVQ